MPFVFLPLALVLGGLALAFPDAFTWARPHIPLLLGVIMFGMGMTLTTVDFTRVARHWPLVALGVVLQYVVMPTAALLISLVFQLPTELLIGMIIVGSCPGGTASNVITYLAKGNVALSVSLTLVSSLLAPFLTPLLILLAAGERVDIAFSTLMIAVAKVVLVPIVLGLIVRGFVGEARLKPALKGLPWLSMVVIAFIIAVVLGLSRETILDFPIIVFLAVVLHNAIGLIAGYYGAFFFAKNATERRTLAIEVGMQNSGLGAALATTYFTGLAALPSALFSLWHNVSGVLLASFWGRRPK